MSLVGERILGASSGTREREEHTDESVKTASKLNWLRAGVLGANDGIVSTAGVVVGVAAADPQNNIAVFTAGMAAVVAGAISMAAGEYVSVSTQKDTEQALVHKENTRLRKDPEGEFAGLIKVYEGKGLSPETARLVAKEYSAIDPVAAQVEARYSIDSEEFVSPWNAAFSSAISFVLGAVLPMLAILLFPPASKFIATFILTLVALGLAGYTSAWLSEAPRGRAVIRVITGGALAMLITGAVGHLVGLSL
ncbi:VIT1/CCC1 transporter family protein [Varibaculum cambriense]|uniref:VIT1/CCC1 transporter family protein n=1 Tax=Varibaculum cambriense TaxID=184870 RepID=UPI00241D8ABF|nr:VIT family protein [Varibaculum cambriense]MBS5943893.1 VIT family protein [Varibaculum cambriense]